MNDLIIKREKAVAEPDEKELLGKGKKVLSSDRIIRPFVPLYLTKEDIKVNNSLESLSLSHERLMRYKYDLYKARSKFYCDKTNWDKCKEETGKATDSVFKEYARKHLAKLMESREVAEFEYEQCLRIFESV